MEAITAHNNFMIFILNIYIFPNVNLKSKCKSKILFNMYINAFVCYCFSFTSWAFHYQFLFSKSKKQMGCYHKVSVITLDEEISHYVHCLMWEPAEGFSNK